MSLQSSKSMVSTTYNHSISPARDLSLKGQFGGKPQGAYVYNPLPTPTSIRVIEWPHTLVPTADLRFQLRTIDLATQGRPAFTTISYSWGTDSSFGIEDVESLHSLLTNTIVCDGSYIRVTENAYNALAELQWRGRRQLFWLDVVCIDQSNLEERSQQVAIMGEIFAKAERTIVWLGEDDACARQAHSIIQPFASPMFGGEHDPASTRSWIRDSVSSSLTVTPVNFFRLRLGTDPPYNLDILLGFFSRSWFQRSWIIQEVVLSQKLWIICGGLTFDWQAMVDIAHNKWLIQALQGLAEHEMFSGGIRGLLAVRIITFLRGDYTSLQRMASSMFDAGSQSAEYAAVVGTLISLYDNSLLSDSRDRFYAPLALANRMCKTIPATRFLPDYEESAETVFINAAYYLLQESQSLSMLTASKTLERDFSSTLPSWVPDLRIQSAQKAISSLCASDATYGWRNTGLHRLGTEMPSTYNEANSAAEEMKSLSLPPDGSFRLVRGMHLEVTGVTVGKISSLTTPILTLIEADELLSLCCFIEQSAGYDRHRPNLPKMLMETMTFGSAWTGDEPLSDQPSQSAFSVWFSFKLLKLHYSGRLQSGDLLKMRQWLLNSDSGFCAKHSTIVLPNHLVNRSRCDICRHRQRLSKMSMEALDQLACGDKPESDISFDTLLRQANIISCLIAEHQNGADCLRTLTMYWLQAYSFQSACKPYVTDRSLCLVGSGMLGMCPRTSSSDHEIWLLRGAKTPLVLRPLETSNYQFIGEAYLDGYMRGEVCDQHGLDQLSRITLV